MHLLPQLRKLERRYQQELVVIGVHSAKFPQEKMTQSVRKAILRYQVDHPVVNDRDFRIWQEYAVRAWPTLMFIDPRGKVIGKLEGEVPYAALEQVVGEMVQQFEAEGLLDHRPLHFRPEQEEQSTALSFPGKVLADAASGRLFIADANHNRILVVDLAGTVLQVIGSGQIGLQDGALEEAQLNRPQGMAFHGDTLYVADTENHAIRRIDLAKGSVETLAGTGAQAAGPPQPGPGTATALNSPWDLVLHEDVLYIAMAGSHQLWQLTLGTGVVQPFAGSGREGLRDGPPAEAWLAQPSGLSSDGATLYCSDSETSALRSAGLRPPHQVHTIAGQGLFEFGDSDGVGDAVRLQHPLGVCWHEGMLYVADTYNNKIKRADPRTREVTTWLGGGEMGLRDGAGREALFYEPGGLSIAGGLAYIADTNNHAVRVANLATGQVTTLELRGAGMP